MPRNNTTDYSKTVIYKIIPINPKSNDDCYYGHCTTNINDRFNSHKSAYKNYKEYNKGHELSIFKLFDKYNGCNDFDILKIEKYPCNNINDALKKEGEYITNNKCCNDLIPNINNSFYICLICNETLYKKSKIKHEQTQKHLNNIKIQNNEIVEVNSRKKIWLCECGKEKYKNAECCIDCTNKYKIIKSRDDGRPYYSELIKLKNEITMKKIGEKYDVSDNCIRKWIKLYEKYNLLD